MVSFTWPKFFFVLFLLLSSNRSHGQILQKGVADLRTWNSEKEPLLTLSGETEFFWQQYIGSEGITAPPAFMKIPYGWNFEGPLPAHGYASYRIRVLLDQPRELRILLNGIYSSARIYIDGKLISTIGQLGKTPETSIADFRGSWNYSFIPNQAAFDIVVEVANFDIFLGGMMTPIYLGTQTGVGNFLQGLTAYSFFLIGTLLIMGLYHFGLFFLRRSDFSTLHYGALCLAVALYMFTGDPADAWTLMSPLGFEGRIYVYNVSWILCIAFMLLYVKSLFPQEFSNRVVYPIAGFCVLYLLAISPFKVRSFVDGTQTFQLVAAIAILYTCVGIAQALRKKRDGIGVFFFSLMILFAFVIHDLIMLRGYFSGLPLAGLGVFTFTFCQSYLISARFSRAFERAESSEAEVRDLNINLEARVEEQTREIRSIMQSIELGIFAIHRPEQLIHRDYSLFLENIFDQKNLENQEALPLLFAQSNISADLQHQVKSVMVASLGESQLNFEVNKEVLPRKMQRLSKQGKTRSFELDWNPILNDEEQIDKVLVTVNDVSDLRKWEEEARHSAEELSMVAEIINIRESEFQRFIKSSQELLNQNKIILNRPDPKTPIKEIIKIVLMNLHTVKGAARTLQFRGLADHIHSMEQLPAIPSIVQDSPFWQQMIQDHEQLIHRLQEYQRLAIDKLGRQSEQQMRLVFPTAEALDAYTSLQELLDKTSAAHQQKLKPLLLNLQRNLFVSLPDLLQEIMNHAHSLARDLDKPKPTLHLDAPMLLVESHVDEMLRHIFFHLIRNAMDHGIETPGERQRLGKPEEGQLSLEVFPDGEELVFVFQDDGQGLQVDRIRDKASRHGLLKEQLAHDPQAIADLMFSFGISTASHVTQISGRGLGMSAVARFIGEFGGRVHIKILPKPSATQSGYPFAICIYLPLTLFKNATQAHFTAA